MPRHVKFMMLGIMIALLLRPAVSMGQATPTCGGDAGLQWNMNTEPDMAKYYVYAEPGADPVHGTTSHFAEVQHDLANAVAMPDGTKVLQESLAFPFPDGVYHFAVSAVDTSGNESGLSNIFICNVQIPPSAPIGFVIIQLTNP